MSKRSREYKFASGEIFYSSARTRTRDGAAGAGAESPPKQKRRQQRNKQESLGSRFSVRREETHKSFEVYSATLYYLLNAARRPFTWVNVSAEINDFRWREKKIGNLLVSLSFSLPDSLSCWRLPFIAPTLHLLRFVSFSLSELPLSRPLRQPAAAGPVSRSCAPPPDNFRNKEDNKNA